jgi:K319L-like, PKD domain/Fibronectin type III domain/Bacterial TSP3 repeat
MTVPLIRLRNPPSVIRLPLSFCILALLILVVPVSSGAVGIDVPVSRSPLSFSWDPASGQVDHYNVYLSVDDQHFELLEETNTNSCLVDVQEGRAYVLQVEAEDGVGRVGPLSDPSERINVWVALDDYDGDEMSNACEQKWGLDPYVAASSYDLDGDRLSNAEECNLTGTSPNREDTDGDGIWDGEEVNVIHTDAKNPDTDGDGIWDGQDPYPVDPLNREKPNNAPVAVARVVNENDELVATLVTDPTVLTLDGSESFDPDGNSLTYSWTIQKGPKVDLEGSDTVSPTIVPRTRSNPNGDYVFELVVSDGKLRSLPDSVTITINNVRPSAKGGGKPSSNPDQALQEEVRVEVDSTVTLGVIESGDPNGDPLTYTWTQTNGTPVSLQDPNTQTASFAAEQPGIYTFELVAFDGELPSTPVQVQVVADRDNHHPTADSGQDLTAKVGETVTLNGSGSSDPDGDPLTYTWTQTNGTPVSLQDPNTQTASFVPEQPGGYVFELVVNDGTLSSPAVDVTVSAESLYNQGPVASIAAIKQPVISGQWVTLDGSGSSDPDGDALSFLWTQTDGPAVTLKDEDQAIAGFYALTEGTPQFQLMVNDGQLSSAPASVEVKVLAVETLEATSRTEPEGNPGSEGCSVGMRGSLQHRVNATDVGYVLTLFLPAIGAAWCQKRGFRRRRSQLRGALAGHDSPRFGRSGRPVPRGRGPGRGPGSSRARVLPA